jgi:hypothetical protein
VNIEFNRFLGKTYTFEEDGASITVKEIKRRDEDTHWVTYLVSQGPGVPRQLLMEYFAFVETYGHLFP